MTKVVLAWWEDDSTLKGIVSSDETVERDTKLIQSLYDVDVNIISIRRAYYDDVIILPKYQKEWEEAFMWEFFGIHEWEETMLRTKDCTELFDEWEAPLNPQEEEDALNYFRECKAYEIFSTIEDMIPHGHYQPIMEQLKDIIDSNLW